MSIDLRKVEYPYYHYFVSEDEIREIFDALKEYKPILMKSTKRNNLFMMKIDYTRDEKFLRLTDYFSEPCRVKCNRKDTVSAFEFYQNNKKEIIKELGNKVDYQTIDRHMYKLFRNFCSNFPLMISIQVLRYFKPKTWLDPSAGWGDRLVSAIAYGCQYTATDPNECMHKYYQQIIDTLGDGDTKKYQVIESGFEDFKSRRRFDLVFTSPPFFDLEEYSDDETQSVIKYPTLAGWIDGFIKELCMNSIKHCKIEGHIAFYVNNAKGIRYVHKVKDFMYDTRVKFLGTISWQQGSYPKEILIWKRIN